jgi:hypothetical protein
MLCVREPDRIPLIDGSLLTIDLAAGSTGVSLTLAVIPVERVNSFSLWLQCETVRFRLPQPSSDSCHASGMDAAAARDFAQRLMDQVWRPLDSGPVPSFYHRDVVGWNRDERLTYDDVVNRLDWDAQTFADSVYENYDLVADEDRFALRFRYTARMVATDAPIDVEGWYFYRLRDGKIAEFWLLLPGRVRIPPDPGVTFHTNPGRLWAGACSAAMPHSAPPGTDPPPGTRRPRHQPVQHCTPRRLLGPCGQRHLRSRGSGIVNPVLDVARRGVLGRRHRHLSREAQRNPSESWRLALRSAARTSDDAAPGRCPRACLPGCARCNERSRKNASTGRPRA